MSIETLYSGQKHTINTKHPRSSAHHRQPRAYPQIILNFLRIRQSNPPGTALQPSPSSLRAFACFHFHNRIHSRRKILPCPCRIGTIGCIASPVHLHLLTGFPVDMHGGTPFVFVLLDVVAELGIHQRVLTGLSAVLHVFSQ